MKTTARTVGIAALVVVGLCLTAQPLMAQTPAVDDILKPVATMKLRASPPSGLLYRKGHLVKDLTPADRLLVIDTRNVRTLFSSDPWVRVVHFASVLGINQVQVHTPPDTGWVYAGEVDKRPVLNNITRSCDRRLPRLVRGGNADSIRVYVIVP